MPVGFQSAFDKPKPPHIRFERVAVERRDAAGNPLYVDIDMAFITQPGSVDTTPKIADEWFAFIKRKDQDGEYPSGWYEAFYKRYLAWKDGQEMPVDGTAIKNWPSASPAEVKTLLNVGILTVEELATINEEVIIRLGMGARSLRQRAVDFLSAQKDLTPVVAELATLKNQVANLVLQNEKLVGTVKHLQSRLLADGAVPADVGAEPPRKLRPLEDRLSEAQAGVDRKIQKDDDLVKEVLDEELG